MAQRPRRLQKKKRLLADVTCDDLGAPTPKTSMELSTVRPKLQGYLRSFLPDELHYRLAEVVALAEHLFDQYQAPGSVAVLMRTCPLGAALLGIVLWLTAPERVIFPHFLNSPDRELVSFSQLGRSPCEVVALGSWGAALCRATRAISIGLSAHAWLPGVCPACPTAAQRGLAGSLEWPLFAGMAMLAERLGLPEDLLSDPTANRTRPSAFPSRGPRGGTFVKGWRQVLTTSRWGFPARLRIEARRQFRRLRSQHLTEVCSAEAVCTLTAMQRRSLLPLVAERIKRCALLYGLRPMLMPSWVPAWRSLDRLGSRRVTNVTARDSKHPYRRTRFKMSLLPPNIPTLPKAQANFWFIADRIRTYKNGHCNPAFKSLVHMLGTTVHFPSLALTTLPLFRPLNVMDVGAHLGDCCFWAARRWGRERIRCIAVEPNPDVVSAMRHTVHLDSLEDVVIVQPRFAGGADAGGCPPAASSPAGPAGATAAGGQEEVGSFVGPVASYKQPGTNMLAMDCLLRDLDEVDMVKIHVHGGMELLVLGGLLESLRAVKISLVLLRTTNLPKDVLADWLKREAVPYEMDPYPGGLDTILRPAGGQFTMTGVVKILK